jgi:porin
MRTRAILISLICNLAVSAAFAQSTVTATDLQHHRWVLETINDDTLPATENKGKIPELDFGEQMQVTGNTGCNQFNGQAVLRDGFFLVEAMASTRMMCPPPWGDIERQLQTALGSESTAILDENRNLILTTAGTSLEFRLEDSGVPHQIGYRTADKGFSAPTSVQAQLDEDDILKDPIFRFPQIDEAFASWNATKKRLNEEKDIQFGIDYNTMSQGISDTAGDEDSGALGILRVYGIFGLLRSNDDDFGRLVVKVDHRHTLFSDIAPAALAGQAGYIGLTGTLFSDTDGLTLVDLNYQQSFNNRRTGFIVGRFDPNDYMDVLGYANPWSTFSNVTSLMNTSIALPDAMLGIGAGHQLNDQWYIKGSINDANGVVTETKAFQGGAEFFKWAEVGWSPSAEQRYLTNVHVVAWHVDKRDKAGIPSAHGFTIGANKTSADGRWMGFMRAGWSDGSAPIYKETYTAGFLRKFRRNADLLGVAVNWGDPPDSSLDSQTTGEFFYRLQFSQNLAITPSMQLLKDPALNPDEDMIWVWSLRIRLTM